MLLVEWTQPNLFTWFDKKATAPTLKLLPGINQVDEKMWAKAEKHPLVKHHLSEENLVVHDEKIEGKAGLSETPVKDAKRIIVGTFDKELLQNWKSGEKRKSVVDAIDAQIKKVDESVKLKEKDDEDDE